MWRGSGLAVVFLLLCSAVRAELAPPRLSNVFPPGARQGAEVDLEIQGGSLEDPSSLYFSHPGITAKILTDEAPPGEKPKGDRKKEAPGKCRFKVRVAADVPVGDYDVRFAGREGLSNPRTFTVGDIVESLEKEPNSEKKDAGRIELNSTVNGRIGGSEDIDWFVFPARKGQRVLVECRAWRIDSRLDGFLWLYDAQGKQLGLSQDEDIRDEKRDPFVDIDIPADGDYFVKLTDFTYNGGGDYFYRLSVSTLPYIDYILPTSVPAGAAATVTIYGRNLPGGEPAGVEIKGRPLQKLSQQVALTYGPDDSPTLNFNGLVRPWTSIVDGREIRVKGEAGSSNARLLRVTSIPILTETQDNHSREKAQRLDLPCSVSGQFDREAPDFFVFSAKKDEIFSVEVYSNRIGSPADPDMEILKADGSSLAAPQDWGENIGQLRFTSNTRDITHTFKAPADGDYTIRLEHLFRQAQGGPHYLYALEVRKNPEPDFRLICTPRDEIRVDSHLLYQGGRTRLDILVWRKYGFTDAITVEARKLPDGVTADPFVIGKDVKWGTLALTAAPGAAIGETAIEIVGTSESNGKKLARTARGGVIVWDTVNTPALSRMTRSILVAVRPKSPFAITASPREITVKKGDPVELTVTLKRGEGMANAVQVNGAGYQLPPGLTVPVKTIDAGQSEVKLMLNTDKMPEGTFSFIVNGDGQVPSSADKSRNIRCVYPSNSVTITVEPKEKKDAPEKAKPK